MKNIYHSILFLAVCTMFMVIVFPTVLFALGPGDVSFSSGTPDFNFQIPISGLKSLTLCETGSDDTLSCPGIAKYVQVIYTFLVGFAAVLAVLAITWGGVQWLLSRGESGKIQEARKIIGNAFVGLIIALGSYAVLSVINPSLTQFSPLRIQAIQEIPLDFESVEKHGEETGDTPKAGEEELEFGDEGEEYSFNYLHLLAMPVYAEAKKGKFKKSGTLTSLDAYIANDRQFGLVPNRCLGWTRISLESIFGTKKIKETAIYPRLEYPATTAHQFNAKGLYVRDRTMAGINNGDVVFMKLASSFLVTRGVDEGPGGDSISHIGVYYNGSIYHQFGSKLSKDTVENGILKGRQSRAGKSVEIIGYGKMEL